MDEEGEGKKKKKTSKLPTGKKKISNVLKDEIKNEFDKYWETEKEIEERLEKLKPPQHILLVTKLMVNLKKMVDEMFIFKNA
jgi:ABC-type phosphate transport system ATPase subunit